MQEILRFVFKRPPQQPSNSSIAALALPMTDFSRRIGVLREDDSPREQVAGLVDTFLSSDEFRRDPSVIPLARDILRLHDPLKLNPPASRESLRQIISDVIGRSAGEIARDADFADLKRRSADSLLALKLSRGDTPPSLGAYYRLLQLISIVELAAADAIEEPLQISQLMRRPILLPEGVAHAESVEAHVPPDDLPVLADIQAKAALKAEIQALNWAKSEILATRARDRTIRTHEDGESGSLQPGRAVLNRTAAGALSERTRDVLSNLSLDPTHNGTRDLVEGISTRATLATTELSMLGRPAMPGARIVLGTMTLPSPVQGGSSTSPAAAFDLTQGEFPKIPESVGLVTPSGVGDLLVTRRAIKGYAADQISYIQSVLKAEKQQRETRRLERVEQSFTSEIETTRVEERDLQSEDRFELSREIKNTIKEDDKFKRGMTISGGYGKFVQAEVSVEKESQTSKEQSAQTASKYARDVSDRAVSKLTERIREERTITILREFEETNIHGFDNTSGDEHVIGIYQWLEEIFEAQVFNYGIRLFFDIMVPEPAAYYLWALSNSQTLGEGMKKPPEFNLSPMDIDETDYTEKVALYGASGVDPPPKEFVIVSKTLAPEDDPEAVGQGITKRIEGSIDIPSGYVAAEVHFRMSWHKLHLGQAVHPEPQPEAILHIGQRQLRIDLTIHGNEPFRPNAIFGTHGLDDETIALPYAFHLYAVNRVVILMELVCQRTAEALDAWRLRTFETLRQAAIEAESDYRNRKAEADAQAGVKLPDRAPFQNRLIERAELKRNAISILTGQYFTLFSAILESGSQEARVNFQEALAEGAYVRFFEQAFEWDNATYEFFDYFWGRRSQWVRRLVEFDDEDPDFQAFLRAGYARVQIPVRPDFETGIFHFLETGQVWDGGELPPVTRAEHVAYLSEIAERRSLEPDAEIPVGEPFELRVPTTLVRVRASSSLPVWEKDENGSWVPVGPD